MANCRCCIRSEVDIWICHAKYRASSVNDAAVFADEDVFVPVIATLANLSLRSGKFQACLKRAQVLPLLKKAGLDTS